MVEPAGNAPASTCLQGRCIAFLPRPHFEIGKSPWCCPRQAEFWRLGCTGWCATYGKLVRLPGIAPGLPPWQGGILAVKSQPPKLKGPRAFAHSRPMPFQQRTNTSWRSTRSQPAVSRRLFRCLGAHLLRSPLNLKFGKFALAALLACSGHTPSVANPGSPLPFSILCRMTSFRCRLVFAHLP